jgi:hypothetical protein
VYRLNAITVANRKQKLSMTMKTISTDTGMESPISTRRSFLSAGFKTGMAATALATLPLGMRNVKAQSMPDCDDVGILNYALTLEHLEASFYIEGLTRFSAKAFRNGTLISRLGPQHVDMLYSYLGLIRDHEIAHVQTLISVIESLGGTPVGPCTYDFGYSNVQEFLAVAQALENTGVMAYDGAIAQICSPELQTAGATIATVEARHASYLNLINGEVPFPSAFDTPKTMEEILAIAGQFIVSCP